MNPMMVVERMESSHVFVLVLVFGVSAISSVTRLRERRMAGQIIQSLLDQNASLEEIERILRSWSGRHGEGLVEWAGQELELVRGKGGKRPPKMGAPVPPEFQQVRR